MKRMICLLLCLALLLPVLGVASRAEEALVFSMIKIDAGSGAIAEGAIFHEGEAYINAEHFSRYTRYRFHPDTNTFRIEGQEPEKALKPITVSPEQKKLAVGTKMVKLSDCFTVDGVLYLPFCQMLPILGAEILAVEDGVILVSNNKLSMAELLYDFNITDYAYNLNEEFFDSEALLLWYTIPSYLFDSVTDFRFDRLDFIADSGAYKDYKELFEKYLRDDNLYLKATKQYDDPGLILNLITGLNRESKNLNDSIDWLKKLTANYFAKIEGTTINAILNDREKYAEYFKDFGVDVFPITQAMHNDDHFLSIADGFEILNYAYNYFTHVEDHFQMLDAVYDFSAGEDFENTQRRGARAVYDLYGDREWYGILKETADKLFENALEDSKFGGEFVLYKLTAKLSGELWERVIPADTEDVSTLTLHAGVVNSAMSSAASCTFDTEESTEDYRLSLLLMMLASRRCYQVMADTAAAYEENDAAYRAKIQKLEAMIQGLYLVADNVRLDTYEYFDDYAAHNRKLLEQAGIFLDPVPMDPEAMDGPGEEIYLNFLATHPEYRYYTLLDVNQDGCMELLASEDNGYPHSNIDLWIWDGSFRLGEEDLWAKYEPLFYSPVNRWICKMVGGTGGQGYWFYSLDETLTVQKQGYEWYDFCGYLYNDAIVNDDDAMMKAWQALADRHAQDPGTEIILSPVP